MGCKGIVQMVAIDFFTYHFETLLKYFSCAIDTAPVLSYITPLIRNGLVHDLRGA